MIPARVERNMTIVTSKGVIIKRSPRSEGY